MFLSAAQEYSSVQFRTLEIDRATDLRAALGGALDRGYTAVEMIHCDGKFFTSEGHVAPSIFGNLSSLNLNPGDVVVMSGGASGISAHLARSLVPFRPRIVFLGRTPIDTAINKGAGNEDSAAEHRRLLRHWRIYTHRESRPHTIPAMSLTSRRLALLWVRWQSVMAGLTESFTVPGS